MKAALLSLAILEAQLTMAVADSLPKINDESLCKARSADYKMRGLPEPQRVPIAFRKKRTPRRSSVPYGERRPSLFATAAKQTLSHWAR
jgi:hypothetical protein